MKYYYKISPVFINMRMTDNKQQVHITFFNLQSKSPIGTSPVAFQQYFSGLDQIYHRLYLYLPRLLFSRTDTVEPVIHVGVLTLGCG